MREETELEEMEWTDTDRKSANKMAGLMFLISLGWVAFLLVTLAPSCPKSPDSYIETGRKYYEKKDYVKSYRNYCIAIKLNPTLYQAYWERANVEIKMDSLEKAIDDMTMYIGSVSDQKNLQEAYYQRGIIMLKQGYKSDACDDFEKSCELNFPKGCDAMRVYCK